MWPLKSSQRGICICRREEEIKDDTQAIRLAYITTLSPVPVDSLCSRSRYDAPLPDDGHASYGFGAF